MKTILVVALSGACLFAGSAWAQAAPHASAPVASTDGAIPPPPMTPPAPPPQPAPAASSSTPQPANIPATARADSSAPGAYFGDTSGRTYARDARVAAVPRCNDATYNKPQTHGSVSMGVASGRFGGNYQAGTVSVVKNLGSCEHPTGSVGFSISVGQSRFGGGRW
ncbi:MAG TPA: hypothetical protein VF292_09110 [Rhodanobacteraceae bacterium]